jgi:hypothetical protein
MTEPGPETHDTLLTRQPADQQAWEDFIALEKADVEDWNTHTGFSRNQLHSVTKSLYSVCVIRRPAVSHPWQALEVFRSLAVKIIEQSCGKARTPIAAVKHVRDCLSWFRD